MSKRLQVLMDEEEYLEVQGAARRQRLTVSEWVRRVLRAEVAEHRGIIVGKLRAVNVASRHEFPTGDIDVMLREIGAGQHQP